MPRDAAERGLAGADPRHADDESRRGRVGDHANAAARRAGRARVAGDHLRRPLPGDRAAAAPAWRAAAPARARAVSKHLRVAVIAGGRSSEHEISVESARSVIGGLDPDRYDVKAIEIHRDGRWELARRRSGLGRPRGGDPAGPDWLAAGGAGSGRRRPPDPARPVRRGRHRAGAPRARRGSVCRSGSDGFGALHGQGSLQGRLPRQGIRSRAR